MANSADRQNNTSLLTSVKTISSLIKGLFTTSTPLPRIDNISIKMGLNYREGLSAMDITTAIMTAKGKLGIPIGPLPSGASNIDNIVEKIRVEKMVNALLTKAKIEIIIPENQIVVKTNGITSSGEAVQGMGVNSLPILGIARGGGIIR